MVDIDTTQIKSYDELIETAKSLNTKKERIDLLGKYFIENVTYAYEFVDILGQSNNYDQQMLMEIQEKYDVWDEEQRAKALLDVRKYLRKEMAKRFHNRELLEQTLETRMKAISEQYGKIFEAREAKTGTGKFKIRTKAEPKRIANLLGLSTENEIYYQGHNLVGIAGMGTEVGAMQACEQYAIYENGLIRNAVCQDYAPWIKKYCDDLQIPCEEVRGKDTVGHAWCLIRFGTEEPIHFDPTNMAFIRDGYGENPTGAEPEQWLGTSIDRMFEMQEGREIYSIGSVSGLRITKDNYKEYIEMIKEIMSGRKQQQTEESRLVVKNNQPWYKKIWSKIMLLFTVK